MNRLSLNILRVKKVWALIKYPKLFFFFLRYRVLASLEHKPIFSNRLCTIIDVGANRGQFSLASYVYTSAKIFAFEPIPAVAKIFASIFQNTPRVTLFNAAIGPYTEKKMMHISSRDDSSSLLPIGPNQIMNYPGTEERESLQIDVSPLSSYISQEDISRPSMLKIDVQGFEMEVLKGCELLFESFDYIYCESSFVELYIGQKLAHEIIKWLDLHQFYLSGIYNMSYDAEGHALQADFLFKRICC